MGFFKQLEKKLWAQSNKGKLYNLTGYVNDILHTCLLPYPAAVYTLIKILTDRIMLENAFQLLTMDRTEEDMGLRRVFIDRGMKYEDNQIIDQIYADIFKKEITANLEIDLSRDPVLPLPWDHNRFVNSITKHGTQSIPWREDKLNHSLTLCLPIGVCFVNGGNHSIFTGAIKRCGTLVFSPECYHEIYDISEMYRHFYFDGTYYRWKNSNKIIHKAPSFEFGCIFEIGRILAEHDIRFKDIHYNPSSNITI